MYYLLVIRLILQKNLPYIIFCSEINNITAMDILTERETEYLSLVAMGFQNTEIAKILYVSPCTVKKTLETIFVKLFAKDRASAVALGFLYGILTLNSITRIIERYRLNTVYALQITPFEQKKFTD